MSPGELLDQAKRLIANRAKGPTDADLRRAVSAAYYAVYHDRVRQASLVCLPGGPGADDLRRVFARGDSHGQFREISQKVGGDVGCWPAWMRGAPAGSPFSVPTGLRDSCRLFVELQTLRHAADYDPGRQMGPTEVLSVIQKARESIDKLAADRETPAGRFYLTAAPLWGTLRTARAV